MTDLFPYGRIIGWVLSVLVSLLLVMSAMGKLTQSSFSFEQMGHIGFPPAAMIPIGIAEIASVGLYLCPPTSLFGSVLLAAYMGGACAAHVRISEPCVAQVIIGIVIWVAFVLRRPDVLRAGLGLRTTSYRF